MPRTGYLWRHIMINTKNTWLHGDARGFRSRNRDIRSSGDCKRRPPPEEYRKLREHFERVAGPEVHLEWNLRSIVGVAMLTYLRAMRFRVLAISITKVHAHVVAELPEPRAEVTYIVGEVKRKSSRAIKKWKPGSVWSAGGEFLIVSDARYLKSVTDYVLYDQGRGAWTWGYQDGNDEGMFARKRLSKK